MLLLGLATLETTNEREGYSAWMAGFEMTDNLLTHVCAFPACRKTRNSVYIVVRRISTMGQFYTKFFMPYIAGKIRNILSIIGFSRRIVLVTSGKIRKP